jgi:hypothetical protein
MEWTKEKPTQDGYYWYRWDHNDLGMEEEREFGEDSTGKIELGFVSKNEIDFGMNFLPVELAQGYFWGPLLPPEFSEEDT